MELKLFNQENFQSSTLTQNNRQRYDQLRIKLFNRNHKSHGFHLFNEIL